MGAVSQSMTATLPGGAVPPTTTGRPVTKAVKSVMLGGTGDSPRGGWMGALAPALGMHGAIIALVWQAAAVLPPKPLPTQTVTVSLLEAPVPQPEVTPPHPQPMQPHPKQKSPVTPIARPQVATPPVPNVVASTAPPTEAAVQVARELAPAAPPAPSAVPVATAPAEPAPVSAPRFDAAYLNNPAPPYPAMSRRLNEQGRTVLRVRVSVEGLPLDIQLFASSGFPRLDEAALEAVRRWKFVPAKQGDKIVEAWVQVPLAFQLK